MGGVITQCEGGGRGIWREGWTAAHKGVYNQVRLINVGVKDPLVRNNYAPNQNTKSRCVTLNVSRAFAMWFSSVICIEKRFVTLPYCETTESTWGRNCFSPSLTLFPLYAMSDKLALRAPIVALTTVRCCSEDVLGFFLFCTINQQMHNSLTDYLTPPACFDTNVSSSGSS